MSKRLEPISPHRWNLSPKEAIALQKKLAGRVVTQGVPENVRLIAGCDVAFDKAGAKTIAALVMLSYPELMVVEELGVQVPTTFPYVPGLLSFREGPAIMKLFEKARHQPDLILFDGQGLAHPRGLGLACHCGLLLGTPSIGVAKSKLYGEPSGNLPLEKGSAVDLVGKDGTIVGRLLRTRQGVKPVYVSVGHGIGLDVACEWTDRLAVKYRLPEPTRLADKLAAKVKRQWLEN